MNSDIRVLYKGLFHNPLKQATAEVNSLHYSYVGSDAYLVLGEVVALCLQRVDLELQLADLVVFLGQHFRLLL